MFFQQLYGKSSIERLGDIGQYAVPFAAAGLSLSKSDRQGLSQLTNSSIVTMSAVYALKYTLRTERPEHGNFSFPSGHTASAFIGAAYLNYRYGFQFSVPAFFASSFVGFSRVHSRKHYTTDVVAGALIAIVSSYYFTTPYAKCVQITPIFERDRCAISIETSL